MGRWRSWTPLPYVAAGATIARLALLPHLYCATPRHSCLAQRRAASRTPLARLALKQGAQTRRLALKHMWRSPSVGAVAWAAQVHVGASVLARNHLRGVGELLHAVPTPLHRFLKFVFWALTVHAFPCLHERALTDAFQDPLRAAHRLLAQDLLHRRGPSLHAALIHPEGYPLG